MTQRSENNLTEIMERLAQKAYARIETQKPEWADFSPVGKQGFKNDLLTMMMDVLDAVDEVEADIVKLQPTCMGHIAHVWPVYNADTAPSLLKEAVGDDTRSSWNWLRLANGDLMIGVFPCGDTYVELSDGPAEQDWQAAQAKNAWHSLTAEVESMFPQEQA